MEASTSSASPAERHALELSAARNGDAQASTSAKALSDSPVKKPSNVLYEYSEGGGKGDLKKRRRMRYYILRARPRLLATVSAQSDVSVWCCCNTAGATTRVARPCCRLFTFHTPCRPGSAPRALIMRVKARVTAARLRAPTPRAARTLAHPHRPANPFRLAAVDPGEEERKPWLCIAICAALIVCLAVGIVLIVVFTQLRPDGGANDRGNVGDSDTLISPEAKIVRIASCPQLATLFGDSVASLNPDVEGERFSHWFADDQAGRPPSPSIVDGGNTARQVRTAAPATTHLCFRKQAHLRVHACTVLPSPR